MALEDIVTQDEYVYRVLCAAAKFDYYSSIFWRVDGEYAPIMFFAICNDVFVWYSADAEPITPENLELFEASLADTDIVGAELFAARARGMRPRRSYYRALDDRVVALFEACGPERTDSDA